MTEPLECRIEWIDAPGIRDAGLARTFARFELWAGGQCVTRALDKRGSAVVNGTNISLLPLAAWIVDSWWTACFEAPFAARVPSARDARSPRERRWHERHGWLSSREGFAVPEVVLYRGEAGAVRVDWLQDPGSFEAMPLQFLSSGSALVPRDVVERELGHIVEGSLTRCEGLASPVVDALRGRWGLILSATADEQRACERAARLGLDAYDVDDVDDALAALLARTDIAVGERVLDDLLDVADDASVPKLEAQLGDIGALLEEAAAGRAPAPGLARARDRTAAVRGRPYERGYERARVLRRDVLGLADDVAAGALDAAIEASLLPSVDVEESSSPFVFRGVHALATGALNAPFVVTRPQGRREGRRFDRARALDVLVSSETPRLVTASFDPDQQESRAFAAELLAPADLLRQLLTSRFVDRDDIAALAAKLEVSPMLIEHQLHNHRVAEVIDA